MRASEFEFRLRIVIIAAIFILGFWAPWIGEGELGRRISLLDWLALEASRFGVLRFTFAIPILIVAGALFSLVGAVLRVWGTSYLGYATVQNAKMQAGWLLADGPYRFMRNPLYVGSWFTMAAIALVMPLSGALFAIVLLSAFYLRLTLGEEVFLSATLGPAYRDYLISVPRFLPRLRGSLPSAGNKPDWLTAVFSELFPIGVCFTMAVLSWRYDHQLMLEGVFWSFVASFLARGLMMALIPTLIFVSFFAVATQWFHMDWVKATVIGFGIALIARAIFFGAKKAKKAASA